MFNFSLIIPTYDRPERLSNCLESLTRLNYSCDRFEVIVVDDGSFESLQPIVQKFEKQLNLQYFQQKNAGPATARNTGADIAKGKYLVFTDDDCQPDSEWLSAFDNVFKQNPNGILGGHTINKLTDNIYSQASQYLIDYLYSYYNSNSQQAKFFTSNNFAIPSHIFHKLDGFDTTFPLAAAEDREFCDRLYRENYQMIYVREAKVYHSHSLTLKSFWRQHFNYGKGAKHFHQLKAKKSLEKKIKIESINFYWQLLIYPFKIENEKSKSILTLLFFVSQIANTLGFFNSKTKI